MIKPVVQESREFTILERVLSGGRGKMTTALARHLLGLKFSAEEKSRMQDLAEKNQEGTISSLEKEDLLSYAKAGCILGILHSQARKALKNGNKPAFPW